MPAPSSVQDLLGGYAQGERDFRGIELRGAILTREKLIQVSLCEANLSKADLSWANVSWADLSNADLSKADLGWADLVQANLSGANLIRAHLVQANLAGANLSGANLSGANLSGAKLGWADLSGANLRGASLSGVDLSMADASRADLSWTDLSKANLGGVRLIRADLIRADLSGTDLSGASLIRADLSGASLNGANLTLANLSKANLRGADLTQAVLSWTVLGDVNLVRANGLANAVHLAPSFVDLASLKLAQGKLPDAFLQGCGLSEWEILASQAYDAKLSPPDVLDLQARTSAARSKPQAGRHVFISYSGENQDFVTRLRDRFRDEGVLCWLDPHDLKSGPGPQVDKALGADAVLLLVLSESSIAREWVQHEVREARSLEKRLGAGANVLCPVSLDDAWTDDRRWSRKTMEQVKEKPVLSFGEWRDAPSFEDRFRTLIDDLRLFHAPPESGELEPD
jgi:uncharacterized protein YjbI with pentapeptide repeats